MMLTRRLWLLVSLALLGCQTVSDAPSDGTAAVPIFDGHADFAIHYARAEPAWSVSAHDISVALPGQADVLRWREGGVYGALATVASDRGPGGRDQFPRLLAALDWLDALAARHQADIAIARSLAELRRAREEGRIALIPAVEGGDQIDGSLDNLRTLHARGVRSMLIVYDHHNDLGDGAMILEQSPAVARQSNGGLSELGRNVVAEMNRLGMLVDLSHAAEETVHEALSVSSAPIIFSHSAARALADTPRNLSDATLRLVRANGGIVMVPLAPYLITTDHWRWWSSGERRYAELVAAHPGDEAAVQRGMEEWDGANPQPTVAVAQVADQIDHIARVAGPDHVGIGSDFDGMGQFAIGGLEHSGKLQALIEELRRRGWPQARLEALGGGNFERVLARVEAAAGR